MVETEEGARFRAALELADLGERLMRQTLRRRHPDETEAAIDDRLRRWKTDRPLDAPGRVITIRSE